MHGEAAVYVPETEDNQNLDMKELAHLRLFANADLESIEGLVQACPVHELAPGEILITAGEVNHNLYLLVSGRLRVHLDSVDSEPVRVLAAGESVGELSVIDHKPTSAYVVTDTPARVLVVGQDIFWALVNASHVVASNMLLTLVDRLRVNNSTVSEGLRLQQVYKRHAMTDELTGLHNRRWLDGTLKRQIRRSSMNRHSLALLMVDIDHFKSYNDRFGHLAGDHVLYAVAHTMLNNIRPTDLIARFGGEEFVVLLPDTDIAGAQIVAERIRQAVAGAVVMMSDESILPPVTVSIGIAPMKPFASAEDLLATADSALYRAKERGRNCVGT
jgi:diguanylate cyclase (GGDEF)-like protein